MSSWNTVRTLSLEMLKWRELSIYTDFSHSPIIYPCPTVYCWPPEPQAVLYIWGLPQWTSLTLLSCTLHWIRALGGGWMLCHASLFHLSHSLRILWFHRYTIKWGEGDNQPVPALHRESPSSLSGNGPVSRESHGRSLQFPENPFPQGSDFPWLRVACPPLRSFRQWLS